MIGNHDHQPLPPPSSALEARLREALKAAVASVEASKVKPVVHPPPRSRVLPVGGPPTPSQAQLTVGIPLHKDAMVFIASGDGGAEPPPPAPAPTSALRDPSFRHRESAMGTPTYGWVNTQPFTSSTPRVDATGRIVTLDPEVQLHGPVKSQFGATGTACQGAGDSKVPVTTSRHPRAGGVISLAEAAATRSGGLEPTAEGGHDEESVASCQSIGTASGGQPDDGWTSTSDSHSRCQQCQGDSGDTNVCPVRMVPQWQWSQGELLVSPAEDELHQQLAIEQQQQQQQVLMIHQQDEEGAKVGHEQDEEQTMRVMMTRQLLDTHGAGSGANHDAGIRDGHCLAGGAPMTVHCSGERNRIQFLAPENSFRPCDSTPSFVLGEGSGALVGVRAMPPIGQHTRHGEGLTRWRLPLARTAATPVAEADADADADAGVGPLASARCNQTGKLYTRGADGNGVLTATRAVTVARRVMANPSLPHLSPPHHPSLDPPRSLRLSLDVLGRMGMAARPLSMRGVRTLSLALADAVAASNTPAVCLLLCELQAASCSVGPASQRIAHFFASAFTSRLVGDGLQQYLAEVPPEVREFEDAWVHVTTRTSFSHFYNRSAVVAVLQAVSHARDSWQRRSDAMHCQGSFRDGAAPVTAAFAAAPAAAPMWQPSGPPMPRRAPVERLHIIDISIESAQTWLALMGQLAGRPQGPPTSLRITILDVMSRLVAVGKDDRAMIREQVQQQLSLAAAEAGIVQFECDVIACFSDEMEEGLRRVNVNKVERRRRWEEDRRCASTYGAGLDTISGAGTGVEEGRWRASVQRVARRQQAAGRDVKEGVLSRLGCRRKECKKSAFQSADGSAAKRLHVERPEAVEVDGESAVAGDACPSGGPRVGPSDVDVLAVSCVLKLQDYCDEGEGGASLREAFLLWVHTLHPDVLLVMEFNVDASGPFLLPRVRECFDFHAAIMDCNDTLCTPRSQQPARGYKKLSIRPDARNRDEAFGGRCNSRGKQGLAQATHLYCPMGAPFDEALHPTQPNRESKQHNYHGGHPDITRMHDTVTQKQGHVTSWGQKEVCLSLGLPPGCHGETSKQGAEVEKFDKPLHRPYVISTERFVFLRTILNVVALDGKLRFIRPWSHTHWVDCLTRLGFTAAKFLPLVGEQVYSSCKGFPDCLGVRVSGDALSLTVCGRDIVSVSIWTNQQ